MAGVPAAAGALSPLISECVPQDALAAGAEVPAAATGVYIGCVWQEYQLLLEQLAVPSSVHVLTGSGMNFLIGRVSYTFGFQGAVFRWAF